MDKISSTLTNLTGFSFISCETAIYRELAPLLRLVARAIISGRLWP